MDDLTLEKTPQVANLWHWHHLKPQLVPQTRKTKVRTLTFNSKQYGFMSFFFQCHSHFLVGAESIVLQTEWLLRVSYIIFYIFLLNIHLLPLSS